MTRGTLYLVGLGPGDGLHMTQAARDALEASEVVVGYRGYVERMAWLSPGKRVVAMDIGQERERASCAVSEARGGLGVAVVSSGDPGVYGMAGPVLQELSESVWCRTPIVPGKGW